METNKRVFVAKVQGLGYDRDQPCEGQGCPNSAVWRIGVPSSVLLLCERCVAEMQTNMQDVRKGRK